MGSYVSNHVLTVESDGADSDWDDGEGDSLKLALSLVGFMALVDVVAYSATGSENRAYLELYRLMHGR